MVAGQELSIWRPADQNKANNPVQWEKLWSTRLVISRIAKSDADINVCTRPAADVMIAKFEPSTSMFATTGRVCKLVSSYHVVSDDIAL